MQHLQVSHYKFPDREPLFRRSAKMFKRLVNNLAAQSNEYTIRYNPRRAYAFPLRGRERNMYSSLACAIDEITPIHMSELPYERLTEDMANAGRADFWCHHCNCHYVIELKRQPIGLSAKKSTNVRNRWDALQRQLDEVKDDFHKSVPDKANAVRLGILVIPARSFKQDEIDWSIEESERLSKVIQEECGKSLTFMSIIKVPPRWWRYKRLTRWEYNPVIVVAGTYRGREHRLN